MKIEKAIAKIKILINRYYENAGREMIEDMDVERKGLIEEIDEILSSVNIPAKNLIIEKLELEELTDRYK